MAEDHSEDDGPISLEGPDEDDEPIKLDEDDEPIALVDSTEGGEFSGGLKTFGVDAAGAEAREFKRALNTDGTGATRCRLFHSKIAIAPLENLEGQINEWLDGEQIEVKHVGHLIGTMEGKRPEPNLLVLVWY